MMSTKKHETNVFLVFLHEVKKGIKILLDQSKSNKFHRISHGKTLRARGQSPTMITAGETLPPTSAASPHAF